MLTNTEFLCDQRFQALSINLFNLAQEPETAAECDLFDPVDMHPLNDAVEIHTNGFEC